MTDLANLAALGAVPGADCSALAAQALANGAPGLLFPPGAWIANDIDLTAGGKSWRAVVRGASPAATSITTSVPGANVFQFCPTVAQEAFLDIADLELCAMAPSGPVTPTGYGIVVIGPPGQEIGKGRYANLWCKNFAAALFLERHNMAAIAQVKTEYCGSGLVAIDCGDLDANQLICVNGTGWAVQITGTPAGQANHMAEGARFTGCGANGHGGGLTIQDYSFVHLAASSYSTCASGALLLDGVSDVTILGGEWAGGAGSAAGTVTAASQRVRLLGAFFYDSLQGLVIAGRNHSLHGVHCTGNAGLDVTLAAAGCDVIGGQLLSTGAAQSLLEIAPAAGNRIASVMAARAIGTIAGNGTVMTP